jgi:hypothetical protein
LIVRLRSEFRNAKAGFDFHISAEHS